MRIFPAEVRYNAAVNILAVETSTELCSVALLRDGDLFVEEALAENRHSELLVAMLRRVFERSHLDAAHMDAFAFGQGPGSFTGIRIACGIVQGIGFAAGRPGGSGAVSARAGRAVQ